MGVTFIDLSVAVGGKAKNPAGATNQSQAPTKSKFSFDPDKYDGVESLKAITKDLQSCCSGSTLYPTQSNDSGGCISYEFRCNRYHIVERTRLYMFEAGHFTKSGVPIETNKQRYSPTFGRMGE